MFAGKQTIADLRDAIAAKDSDFATIEAGRAQLAPAWQQNDPAGFAAWGTEWAALRTRYNAARAAGLARIARAADDYLPDGMNPATDEWNALFLALAKYPGGPESRGDYMDLYRRLAAVKGQNLVFHTPQPTGVDFDSQAYKAADGAIRAGENALTGATPWVAVGAVVVGAIVLSRVLR